MFDYGITADFLKDKDYMNLIFIGSTPALIKYKDSLKNNNLKLSKLNSNIKKLKEDGIKFNEAAFIHENRMKTYARLFALVYKVGKLPFRTLINPFIDTTLNNKLSKVHYEVLIEHMEKQIKSNNLKIDNISFNTREVNQIKFSIVYLTQFMTKAQPVLNVSSMCLSKDAQKVFIRDGFEGLYKIAKKNKLKLREVFKIADEIENRYFFKYASTDLGHAWNVILNKRDRERIPNAIESLYWDNQRGFDNYPIYYLYNEKISIQKLDQIRRLGYTKMKHIKALDTYNEKLYRYDDIFNVLFEAFGDYSL
jgi:hypothetical protein